MSINGQHEGPQVGQLIEVAIWLNGQETEEDLRRWVEETIPSTFKAAEARDRIVLGSVRYTEKLPGQDRVPPVPRHISGPNVRLLVAEAVVLGKTKPVIEVGFIGDLTDEDLQRLRRLTRRAHQRAHPDFPPLTDAQCDAVINMMGPQAAVATLRKGATLQ